MSKFSILILSVLFALLISCNNKKEETPVADTDTTVVKPEEIPMEGIYQVEGDSLVIPYFDINLELSQKAKDRIVSTGETIIIDAFFSGEAKDTAGVELAEDGQYYIAEGKKEIRYGETARFEHIKFSRKQYGFLADKDIDLLINVYTGRHTTGDNLLDCDILSDKISKVKGRTFTLKGKLIYGDTK